MGECPGRGMGVTAADTLAAARVAGELRRCQPSVIDASAGAEIEAKTGGANDWPP
jgi:hypothetical protein